MRSHLLHLLLGTSLLLLPACTGGGPETETTTDPTADPGPDEPGSSPLDLPDEPYEYANVELPAHFASSLARGFDNTPDDNPITNDGATLGRVLFYDESLSANRTIACASCHAQQRSFADAKAFSPGFEGGLTGRSSMAAIDARYYRNGSFFWDERAVTLEDQVLMPIQNEVEMGLTLDEAVLRVASEDHYPPLFERAFGDPEVTSDRMARALAQFVRSIVSYRSRYDESMAEAGAVELPFPNFTAEENQGKALFLGKAGCAACHLDNGPPPPPGAPVDRVNEAFFFIDFATNNGLPRSADDADDDGVGGITGNPGDIRRFKSSSLRNVALTAPYMHDGRFADLAAVIEHYDSGVEAQPTLDGRLRVPGTTEPRKLNLTAAEKAALVAFLGTLTDEALLADPRFSSPFIEP
jgi:cytochrome c peroxidase